MGDTLRFEVPCTTVEEGIVAARRQIDAVSPPGTFYPYRDGFASVEWDTTYEFVPEVVSGSGSVLVWTCEVCAEAVWHEVS